MRPARPSPDECQHHHDAGDHCEREHGGQADARLARFIVGLPDLVVAPHPEPSHIPEMVSAGG